MAAGEDLSAFDILVVGKACLKVDGPAPDIGRVRDGLKVVVFEQKADVLEKRLGFRVAEYGLRQVFPRMAHHPLLDGLGESHLRDWRGEATILPARLDYEMRPRHGPTVRWCDIPVTRVWRCGNRGNVASVLIEKPARGSFSAGRGRRLQLAVQPALRVLRREGNGPVLSARRHRTHRDGYGGGGGGTEHLPVRFNAGSRPQTGASSTPVIRPGSGIWNPRALPWARYGAGNLASDQVLVVGPGGGPALAADAPAIADWLKAGGQPAGDRPR